MTLLTLRVGKPAHGGHCVARHDGRAVFVRHALPGELVEARVADDAPDARFWFADTVTVLEPSPDRVEHPWPEASAGGVGGAELGHVSLAAQREWKLAVVREAFERFAQLEYAGAVHAAPGDDDAGGLAYRTRISAVAGSDGKATMAIHGTGERRRIARMPLAVPKAEEALLSAAANPGERIDVAVSTDGTVSIGTSARRGEALSEVVDVGGTPLRYRVRGDDFWQVHREAPRLLANAVVERVGDADRVVELYAGVGLFSVALAAGGVDVTAIELAHGKGGSSLERNLERYPGATAVVGDARREVERLAGSERLRLTHGAVVLDPPRSGAKAATIAAIVRLEPARIVYVACDPVALARDTALLAGHGYDLADAEAWDLFPMTHHVETIATFVRR